MKLALTCSKLIRIMLLGSLQHFGSRESKSCRRHWKFDHWYYEHCPLNRKRNDCVIALKWNKYRTQTKRRIEQRFSKRILLPQILLGTYYDRSSANPNDNTTNTSVQMRNDDFAMDTTTPAAAGKVNNISPQRGGANKWDNVLVTVKMKILDALLCKLQ